MLLMSLLTLSSLTASAANYGMAGCGIGSLAFKDQPGKIQIVAALLNNFIVPQTSAITSGTSNCNEASGKDSVMEAYLETNTFALQNDISKGNGETLTGLLTIMSCNNFDSVSANLKNNYSYIYQDQNNNNQVKARLTEKIQATSACQVNI